MLAKEARRIAKDVLCLKEHSHNTRVSKVMENILIYINSVAREGLFSLTMDIRHSCLSEISTEDKLEILRSVVAQLEKSELGYYIKETEASRPSFPIYIISWE